VDEKQREILEERERAAKALLEITGWFKYTKLIHCHQQ